MKEQNRFYIGALYPLINFKLFLNRSDCRRSITCP